MLLNKYFTIRERREDETGSNFLISLNPDHQVYQGHFPGDPICPGVCSIQMIRECAEIVLGQRLTIGTVSQCRFMELLTPSKNKDLLLKLTLSKAEEGMVKAVASILSDDAQTSFLEYKGEYSPQC
ncbi:MAG: 3-hydroxylacyl-ACP dehydratase [Paludibacteraceae bacterium]|jgi:3-hydroxymyristoyl/3-hydroxydecanoyl-(acyl carrier protein) dehydratases|nr:3-hydroxylacyl-ACP dehydratase [Paludibacteraceae bacterium]